jgi:hypothetical protein
MHADYSMLPIHTLDSQPIHNTCDMARTNRNCTLLERCAWVKVPALTTGMLEGSGSNTYLSERSCSQLCACNGAELRIWIRLDIKKARLKRCSSIKSRSQALMVACPRLKTQYSPGRRSLLQRHRRRSGQRAVYRASGIP